MRNKLFVIFILLAAAAIAPIVSAQESKEAALVRQAKITMAEARQKALTRVPGNIESGKLEREKGKLWFEFEIHKADTNAEVEIHIDAVTGEVGEIEELGDGSAKESEMFRQVKVSFDDAERTALNRVAGSVVMLELERERGKILYEFEIITSEGKEVMIHVDAVSGEVEQVKQD